MSVVRLPMIIALLIAIFLGSTSTLFVVAKFCGLPLGTSLWVDKENISKGYVLVSPYYGGTQFSEPGRIHLIDENGAIRHTWTSRYTTLISYLQQDDHLFVGMTPPLNINDYPSGGSMGIIQELDWNSEVLWEYKDLKMTHDFEVMPDKSIAYIRWHEASPLFASRVRGGMQLATTSVWTNEIVVVNRGKNIVWSWLPDDHLDPVDYVLNPLIARNDWAHMNSIRYVPENPLTKTPAFLVSARNISTVFLIEYPSGKILWQSPKDMFALQHDATLVAEGRILVFDNGLLRKQPKTYVASRVVEVDPNTNEITWTYDGGKSGLEKIQFASNIMSGAQRLENGNTLISASMLNTLLEVTPDGSVAWKYTNDFRDEAGRMHVIFKARKYPAGARWEQALDSVAPGAQLCAAIR